MSWAAGFEFGGVDEGEQVAVTVEEGAVHTGLAGDAGDADRRAVLGCCLQSVDHPLPSAVGVSVAAFAHRGAHVVPPKTDVGQGLADAGHAEHDGPAAADHRDGFLDLRLILGEVVEVGFDTFDQAADPPDLLLGRRGLAARPVVRFEGGHQPLAAAQQVGEVCLKVGQVGDVRAEVIAADTTEAEGQLWPPAATFDGSRQIP